MLLFYSAIVVFGKSDLNMLTGISLYICMMLFYDYCWFLAWSLLHQTLCLNYCYLTDISWTALCCSLDFPVKLYWWDFCIPSQCGFVIHMLGNFFQKLDIFSHHALCQSIGICFGSSAFQFVTWWDFHCWSWYLLPYQILCLCLPAHMLG